MVPLRDGAGAGRHARRRRRDDPGHPCRAGVTIRGTPDPATGMTVDLWVLEQKHASIYSTGHRLLNRIDTGEAARVAAMLEYRA
jgi:hypothetical protein